MVSRPCRKIRPSSHDDRGVSCVSSSCHGSVGFLTRYDEDLREPLVQCQVSQVSMRVKRGRVSWLSSHGRGIATQHILKHSRGLSRVMAENPGFPRLVPVTSGSFSLCLSELRDTVELVGASRDSTGCGAMEEGFISSGRRNLRLPLRF